jgi:hypothetical protein
MTNRLQWDVLVSVQIPVVTSDLPPGASEMKWSPISSTLISGERDAVLVDTAITVDQNQKLVGWIAHSGKNLTAIYALRFHRAYVLVNKRPSHAYMEILEIEILPFQPGQLATA